MSTGRPQGIFSCILIGLLLLPALPAEGEGSWNFSATQYQGTTDLVDPFMQIGIGFTRSLSGQTSLSLHQPVTKQWIVGEDEQDVKPGDTRISLSRPLPGPVPLQGSLSLTLPVSEFSREQEVMSRPGAGLSTGGTIPGTRLTWSLSGGLWYQFNSWETTVTSPGAGGGQPLPHFGGSLHSGVVWQWLQNLAISLDLGYGQTWLHSISQENPPGPGNRTRGDGLLRESYSFNPAMSWTLSPALSLSCGYDNSDLVEKTAGLAEYFYQYNEEVATYYVGLQATL